MSGFGYQPIASDEDLDKEGGYEWGLEDYANKMEQRDSILTWNLANPTDQRPVPPKPTRPSLPPRPTPRPVPERPPFVDPWA